MKLKIKTLTPIWTGDVERKSEKLRETSIIGSLRWWFEAIVRGLGGKACGSTSKEKCLKEGRNSLEKRLCAVCYLFGATEWSRRFKLEIRQSFRNIYDGTLVIRSKNKSWYYPSGLISCDRESNTIRKVNPFSKINRGEYNLENILKVLMSFISRWGMVGGKTAIGYGVVNFEDEEGLIKPSKDDINGFFEYLEDKKNHGVNAEEVPKLSEMFFVKIKIKDDCLDGIIKKLSENIGRGRVPRTIFKCNGVQENINGVEEFLTKLRDCYGFIPVSALIRRELRRRFRKEFVETKDTVPRRLKRLKSEELNKLRHSLMGELGEFSKINVSHVYWNGENWEMRIWGWIPQWKSPVSREDVIEYIKHILNDQSFWEKSLGVNLPGIVEYPNNDWNFIDMSSFNVNELKDTFEGLVAGDKNV